MLKPVGRLIDVLRYPVKSMAGEHLHEAELDWQGIEGDRQFSFYRTADATRFPWLTGRDVPDLIRFSAYFRDANRPSASAVDVITPEGEQLDLHDAALLVALSQAAKCPLGLLQVGRGTYDSMPISIATTGEHKALDAAHGRFLDPRRFRSNLLIDADVAASEWVGRRLVFGGGPASSELLVTTRIPRCSMITIDPVTGARDAGVMRTVAQKLENTFGIYGTTSKPGRLRAGDPVFVVG